MQKNLYLLEWKLSQSRVWLGWLVLWAIISFLLFSALMMTGHLLGKSILPPAWVLIWLSPLPGFVLKIRVMELNTALVNTVYLGGTRIFRWYCPVEPGVWSVDRINGRYRLNRITTTGRTVHYLWRPRDVPLFLVPARLGEAREAKV